MNDNNGLAAETKVYPLATADGFFYDDESNEQYGIESKDYENGNMIRRCTLSDGSIAIIRELTGSEMGINVNRLSVGNKDLVQFAILSIATKFGEAGKTMEEIMQMKGKDYLKIQVANSQINF